MAKSASFFLSALLLLLCILVVGSSVPDNYYQYAHPSLAGKIDVSTHFVFKRDVASSNASTITAISSSTPSNSSAEKKPAFVLKKDEVDQFPDTKEPYTRSDGVSVKPSKYDKYGKGDKKPLGKPGEKPSVKPESSSEDNSSTPVPPVEVSTPSTIASTRTSVTVAPALSNRDNSSSSNGDFSDLAEEDDSPLNITGYSTNSSITDHHRYYDSYAYSGEEVKDHLWVDLENLQNASESELLSSAHRQAFTLSLPFDFPFYGHILRNITIATGGFLYTGDLMHTWLAATQYIAPLMANFDTSASTDSKVKYVKNDTALTVQWENVKLKEKLDGGSFTFQVTIHNTGDIVFSYKEVPIPVHLIADDDHPVKVGLSDAYIVHKTIFYVRRKTIYEYHKIDMKKPEKISNWTAILFRALPTCVSFHDCNSCVTQNSTFQCRWCEKVRRCSDGMDRHRQEWLQSRCDYFNSEHVGQCKPYSDVSSPVEANAAPPNTQAITKAPTAPPAAAAVDAALQPTADMLEDKSRAPENSGGDAASGVGAGVTVAILVCLLVCVVGWLTYAYFFPHTTSGQLLIKYRPSTWSFKRGEARYTAASMHSIHM